jgi:acetyl-CoA carboxylase biotin carboxyl carrier protein
MARSAAGAFTLEGKRFALPEKSMSLSHTDVRRILGILDSAEHLESLDVTVGDFVLQARKAGAASSAREWSPQAATIPIIEPAPAPAGVVAAPEPLAEVPAGLVAVRSPMVGTFYMRPSPDQPRFVEVGSAVEAGDTVCLVEVMKMFNSVKAGVVGMVERILIDEGKPVQHDQIVMLIKPTKEG